MKAIALSLVTLTLTGALVVLAAAPRLPARTTPSILVSAPIGERARTVTQASQWRPFWQRPNDFYIPEAFAAREHLARTPRTFAAPSASALIAPPFSSRS